MINKYNYDEETGILTDVKTGRVSGHKDKAGYMLVWFNGKRIMAHRAAWIIIHGSIDSSMQIDHINRIRDDNRLSNLRLVSPSDNNKNIGTLKSNKSGKTGVFKKGKRWRAAIKIDKKSIHLGMFDTFQEACDARVAAEVEHNFKGEKQWMIL